jgi:hypothetical protein
MHTHIPLAGPTDATDFDFTVASVGPAITAVEDIKVRNKDLKAAGSNVVYET